MSGIGFGSTSDFFSSEFVDIDLRDKRLEKRALTIFSALQRELTSCVRRLFKNENDMRQAYDFF